MTNYALPLFVASVLSVSQAWVSVPNARFQSQLQMFEQGGAQEQVTRQAFFQSVLTTGALVAVSGPAMAEEEGEVAAAAVSEVVTLPSGVSYIVKKVGEGPKPEIGELAAIRFAAYCNDFKIDDIFGTPEPYYTRIGSGGLLKGVEQVLPMMQLGDRWELTIPGSLAFGKQGRKASAGKPRIPADATIVFDVEMVGLPGKEPELIELIGNVDDE